MTIKPVRESTTSHRTVRAFVSQRDLIELVLKRHNPNAEYRVGYSSEAQPENRAVDDDTIDASVTQFEGVYVEIQESVTQVSEELL